MNEALKTIQTRLQELRPVLESKRQHLLKMEDEIFEIQSTITELENAIIILTGKSK